MFGKAKPPWDYYVKIERVELNNGDVKYKTDARMQHHFFEEPFYPLSRGEDSLAVTKTFESFDDAKAFLDAWWKDWWPKQVKSTRRA